MKEKCKTDGVIDSITLEQTEKIVKQMKNCICKIINGKKIGTGFFCKISKNNKFIPLLITSYHILDDNFIKTQKQLKLSLFDNQECKIINIDKDSKLYSSKEKEYDMMVLRLKQDDGISDYLEFDNNIFNENSEILYGNESIYILHYPRGEKSAVSFGMGFKKSNNYEFKHLCNTESGSSGSPILNLTSNKLIGIHRGYVKGENINFNIGTFLKKPLAIFKQILINSKFNSYFISNQDLMNYNKNNNIIRSEKKKNELIKGKFLIPLDLNSIKNFCTNHNEIKKNKNIMNNNIKLENKTLNNDYINKNNNINNNLMMINQDTLKKKLIIIKKKSDNYEYKTVKNSFKKNMNDSMSIKSYSANKNLNINKLKSSRKCHTLNNLKNNSYSSIFEKKLTYRKNSRENSLNKINKYNLNYKIFSNSKNETNKSIYNNFGLKNRKNNYSSGNSGKKSVAYGNYFMRKNNLNTSFQGNDFHNNKINLNKVKLNNNIIFNNSSSSRFLNLGNFSINNNKDKTKKISFEKIKNNKLNYSFQKSKLKRNNFKKNNTIKFSTLNTDNISNNTNGSNNPYVPNKLEKLKYLPNTSDTKDITSYYYISSTVQCLLNVEQLSNFFLLIKKEEKYKEIPGKLSKLFLSIIDNLCENKLNQYYKNVNLIFKLYSSFKNKNGNKSLIEFFIGTLHKELNKVIYSNGEFNYFLGQSTDKNFEEYFQKNFQSIILDIFYLKYQSRIKCLKCNFFTKNIKLQFLLSFPLGEISKSRERNKDSVTFSECLSYYNRAKYTSNRCNFCKNNYLCEIKNLLLVGPKVVIIYLDRGSEPKFDIKFDFNEKLNLTNFIEDKNISYNYQLIGVVTYIQKNQFIAFCRRIKDRKWYRYDGPNEQESSFEEVKNEGIHYLLFYSLI